MSVHFLRDPFTHRRNAIVIRSRFGTLYIGCARWLYEPTRRTYRKSRLKWYTR